MALELYATASCPFCAELRARLDWDGVAYVEYDVEADEGARRRFFDVCGPEAVVPLLVEDGRVREAGVGGRGCTIAARR